MTLTRNAGRSATLRARQLRVAHWSQQLPRVGAVLGLLATGTAVAASTTIPGDYATSPAGVAATLGVWTLAVVAVAQHTLAAVAVPREVRNWQRGAAGERATARLLRRLPGWTVLHDRALPRSRANVDHLLVGPGGVVVVDSKCYRTPFTWTPLNGWRSGLHDVTATVAAAKFETRTVAAGLEVPAMTVLAVHGCRQATVAADGVLVISARHLQRTLRRLPQRLDGRSAAALAQRATQLYPPAA